MEWISVDDRLPGAGACSLVYDGERTSISYHDGNRFDVDEMAFYLEKLSDEPDEKAKYVTHWMPLPPPPQTMTEAEQIEEVKKGRT